VIVHTTDGGANWLEQSSGTAHSLQSVDFVDFNTGWAVGGNDSGRIIHTSDGGATWTRQAEDWLASIWNGVDFVDGSQGWAVGTGGAILKTVDGGAHWFGQSSGVGATLQAVRFMNASTGWAVGNSGTILKFTRDFDAADFNHDYAVDAQDLLLLAEFLAGNAQLPFGDGDVNGDGSTDSVDLALLQHRITTE
jgi:photosystem II stability/assembly factor-like uncharacterized protein